MILNTSMKVLHCEMSTVVLSVGVRFHLYCMYWNITIRYKIYTLLSLSMILLSHNAVISDVLCDLNQGYVYFINVNSYFSILNIDREL